jgi:hypothetical protein
MHKQTIANAIKLIETAAHPQHSHGTVATIINELVNLYNTIDQPAPIAQPKSQAQAQKPKSKVK